jgi:hypothetical protein
MSTTDDGFLVDWGDRPNYKPIKGRRGKNIRGGAPKPSATSKPPTPSGKASARAMRFAAMVKGAPEAVVKVTGGGKNLGHIKAHLDYISRNGEIAVEDETGLTYMGADQVREIRDAWGNAGYRIPRTGEERKEAINIIFSMPAGTSREAVTAAVREFAKERFSDHQYVFAQHDDEKHAHVHLTVKKVNHHGTRLNPKKQDLQDWREHFVERLWDQGVHATATHRRARGVVFKHEKAKLAQMQKNGKDSYRVAQRAKAVAEAVSVGKPNDNPAAPKIATTRHEYHMQYGGIAKKLASSSDPRERAMALDIVNFVQGMPPQRSQHQVTVDAMLAEQRKGQGTGRDRTAPKMDHAKTPKERG